MDQVIRYVKGVGPKKEKILNRIGVFTLRDLLYYFPVRYEDRRKVNAINSLSEGDSSLIRAQAVSTKMKRSFYGRKTIFQAILQDSTGSILSVWFNQPYLNNYIEKGKEYYFYGKVRFHKGRLQLVAPEFDSVENESDSYISGIVPFYRLTYKLTQNALRKLVYYCLSATGFDLTDPLPFRVRKEYGFPNIKEALIKMHYPPDFKSLRESRRRFIFEEFFLSQILIYRRKAEYRMKKRIPLRIEQDIIKKVENNFGYKLTNDQEKSLNSIISDLSSPYRNSRLLQGDVGSGKTIVACIASFCVAASGFQAAFMVPTEVLAFQHFETLKKLSENLNIRIAVFTSSLKKKQKDSICRGLENGELDIVIGTHALLDQKLKLKNLRLIVIDEQHRFGVAQRAVLAHKGTNPDVLVMSATPIPRSLALTFYGDLESSQIKEYPKGRKFPDSKIIKEKDRVKMYDFIREKVKQGRQAYIIYALVDDNEETDLYPAVDMFKELKKEFKNLNLGLLHGRLKPLEKQEVLKDFRKKKIDVLVSTLVVEVGVDVPNATLMAVENPERFGAAQLHQLRGRIMRSTFDSYFFMVVKDNIAESSLERLKIIEKTNDGFEIAEEDLKLRGAGDLFGTVQAGFLPQRVANIKDDLEMLKSARKKAFEIIEKDPRLELSENKNLRREIEGALEKCLFWQPS